MTVLSTVTKYKIKVNKAFEQQKLKLGKNGNTTLVGLIIESLSNAVNKGCMGRVCVGWWGGGVPVRCCLKMYLGMFNIIFTQHGKLDFYTKR